MAKIKSPFKIVGTIDNINFYVDEGKNVARTAGGGFDGEAIRTKPSMVRVRENGSEFGHCASVKSTFLRALRPFILKMRGRRLHSGMTSMFVQIKNYDPVSKRGERKVGLGLTTLDGFNLLMTYSHPERYSIEQVLGNRFVMDWNDSSCHCANFQTNGIQFPEYATHVGLLFGVVVMDFDAISTNTFLAEEFVLSKTAANQAISLPPTEPITGSGRRIGVMGVRYYQEVNGILTKLETKRGFGVVGVAN